MRLGPLSVVNGILWAVSGEECIEQQTYVFDNIFNQHYWHLFTNGRQMPVHNFLILLFIIWHCFTATWRWLFYMHYVKDNTKPVYTILAYRLIVIGTSRFFCLVLRTEENVTTIVSSLRTRTKAVKKGRRYKMETEYFYFYFYYNFVKHDSIDEIWINLQLFIWNA